MEAVRWLTVMCTETAQRFHLNARVDQLRSDQSGFFFPIGLCFIRKQFIHFAPKRPNIFWKKTPARLPTAKTPKHYLRLQQIFHYLGFQSVYIDADIDTVKKLSAAIIYVAPSYYVRAVAISVNCSDHDNFGNDNNVCVHDQIELSVERSGKIRWYLL
jgi:hypothetical protein